MPLRGFTDGVRLFHFGKDSDDMGYAGIAHRLERAQRRPVPDRQRPGQDGNERKLPRRFNFD